MGSTGAHRIRISLDEEDLIEAYRPAPRPQRQARFALLLALALALLILALLVAFPGARRAFTTSPLIAGLAGAVVLAASLVAVLLAAAPRLRRRAARSTLEHHPGMADPMVCSFDHEHFALETTRTMGRYPWSELWDWRETERVIIVLPNPRNFYVLPKRQFEEGVLEQLRSSLSQCRCRRSPSRRAG